MQEGHRIFEHFSVHKFNVIVLMKENIFSNSAMVWMDFDKKL